MPKNKYILVEANSLRYLVGALGPDFIPVMTSVTVDEGRGISCKHDRRPAVYAHRSTELLEVVMASGGYYLARNPLLRFDSDSDRCKQLQSLLNKHMGAVNADRHQRFAECFRVMMAYKARVSGYAETLNKLERSFEELLNIKQSKQERRSYRLSQAFFKRAFDNQVLSVYRRLLQVGIEDNHLPTLSGQVIHPKLDVNDLFQALVAAIYTDGRLATENKGMALQLRAHFFSHCLLGGLTLLGTQSECVLPEALQALPSERLEGADLGPDVSPTMSSVSDTESSVSSLVAEENDGLRSLHERQSLARASTPERVFKPKTARTPEHYDRRHRQHIPMTNRSCETVYVDVEGLCDRVEMDSVSPGKPMGLDCFTQMHHSCPSSLIALVSSRCDQHNDITVP